MAQSLPPFLHAPFDTPEVSDAQCDMMYPWQADLIAQPYRPHKVIPNP
jgi:hypothetical protein